jgi:hypothetical protein
MDDQTDDDGMGNGSALPTHTVNAADRLQRFREDDDALAELAEITHKRAMADGENANASGHLDLKIRERRAAMWGYDSPQRFDMLLEAKAKEPDDFERAHAAIMRIANEGPPAQRALRARLEQLGPEKALELLGEPEPLEPSAADDGDAPTVPAS